MALDTLSPADGWDVSAHAEAVATLTDLDDATRILVWCDDGCVDCRAQLPDFAAALEAAGIGDERLAVYPVDRLPEGRKEGPLVEEYGITLIPTVVVERDGRRLARYEEGPPPIAESLAEQLGPTDRPDIG